MITFLILDKIPEAIGSKSAVKLSTPAKKVLPKLKLSIEVSNGFGLLSSKY